MTRTTKDPTTYPAGQRLQRHTGSVWEVVANNLEGDGKTWGGGMVLCQGDYTIRCISAYPTYRDHERSGNMMRVHADYLHGDGWRLAEPQR